jgi:MarC family membrane protein
MSPLLIKISKDFATIWTTIDPIGNIAIFAGLTASLTPAERRRTALRATIYATVILVVAVVAGQFILDAIGIHLHSLKVAGGIILFLFGLQMLFGRMDAEAKAGVPEAGRDLAVFPLAVPSIAGPGAMMAVILLTDNDVYTVAEASPNRRCPARRPLAHLCSAAFFRCHPADHRPSGSRHSCPCHGDHFLLTRGGNRAHHIGGGKLGTCSALQLSVCF